MRAVLVALLAVPFAGCFQSSTVIHVKADGSESVEHFTDSAELKNRQVALERELEDAGWSGPHGWNL